MGEKQGAFFTRFPDVEFARAVAARMLKAAAWNSKRAAAAALLHTQQRTHPRRPDCQGRMRALCESTIGIDPETAQRAFRQSSPRCNNAQRGIGQHGDPLAEFRRCFHGSKNQAKSWMALTGTLGRNVRSAATMARAVRASGHPDKSATKRSSCRAVSVRTISRCRRRPLR
jgi:hypothetical protein